VPCSSEALIDTPFNEMPGGAFELTTLRNERVETSSTTDGSRNWTAVTWSNVAPGGGTAVTVALAL